MQKSREQVMEKLIEMQYTRSDIEFLRGTFRVKGDIIDVYEVGNNEHALRIEFFGDEIDKLTFIEPISGKTIARVDHELIYPRQLPSCP